MSYGYLPLIQCKPGPTDAELEAQRDAKHTREVAQWFGMDWVLAGLTAGAVAVAGAGPAEAFPVVGGNGLCPNAWNLIQYIEDAYPGVQSIGGVRADALPDHPSGHAVDIMVGTLALGDSIAADVRRQGERFGVKYVLWRVANHFNHVHVTVL